MALWRSESESENRMTLGEIANVARAEAARRGHRLSEWKEGANANGMNWSAHCLECGAMAIAEFDGMGVPIRNGGTRRRSCEAVLASKGQRKA